MTILNNMPGITKSDSNSTVPEISYQLFFERAADGMLILDAVSRNVLDANLAVIKLLDRSRENILGKRLEDLGIFTNSRETEEMWRTLNEENRFHCEELTIETGTRETRRIELSGNMYADGEQRFIQIIVRDVSAERNPRIAALEKSVSAAPLAQIAGKIARLGGWEIKLPERELIWSDENCLIHEVPPGYKPTIDEGIGYYPPQYQAEVLRYVENCAQNGTPYDFEFPKYTAKGRLIWVRSIGEAVRDENGSIIGLQGAFQDITDRKQAEEALRESEEQYKRIVEHASDIIYKTDAGGRFTFVNPAVIKILQYTEAELLKLQYLDVIRPDFQPSVKRFYTRQLIQKVPDTYHEMVAVAKDGTEVWLGQHTQLLYKADKIVGFQAICRDVTGRKQLEDQLRQLSLTDELTGLYNRRGFIVLAEHQLKLAQNKRIEKKLLVIYVDLDGLKQINDAYGHDEGSRAIIKTSEILKQSFRQSDLVARFGGDEFVVLAIEANEENTDMIVSRLRENFRKYNAEKTHDYELSFSFGIARFDSQSEFKIENLITSADERMYHQKRSKHESFTDNLL